MGRTPGQHADEIANTIVGWLKERLGAVRSRRHALAAHPSWRGVSAAISL